MGNIVRISEAASIAIHTMAVLASNPKKVMRTAQIAEALDVSEAHLAKVLQRLTKAGMVTSERGPKGGFLAAKNADSIRLLDIYELIDGPLNEPRCLLNLPVCQGQKCMFGDALHNTYRTIRQQLEKTTLADVKHLMPPVGQVKGEENTITRKGTHHGNET